MTRNQITTTNVPMEYGGRVSDATKDEAERAIQCKNDCAAETSQ